MIKIVALIALAFLASCVRTPEEKPRVCATAPYVNDLPKFERSIVRSALSYHMDSTCENDECDYRVEKLANGNYIVKLKSLRFVPELKGCVTVFMSEWAEVYDAAGKNVDSWPYCYLMNHELQSDPSFKPDPISFSGCGVRSNNSFKPTPHRGVGHVPALR